MAEHLLPKRSPRVCLSAVVLSTKWPRSNVHNISQTATRIHTQWTTLNVSCDVASIGVEKKKKKKHLIIQRKTSFTDYFPHPKALGSLAWHKYGRYFKQPTLESWCCCSVTPTKSEIISWTLEQKKKKKTVDRYEYLRGVSLHAIDSGIIYFIHAVIA